MVHTATGAKLKNMTYPKTFDNNYQITDFLKLGVL